MEKIGDFGEVLVDKAPERDICAFGEDCTGVASTPNQRICAFGEECGEVDLDLLIYRPPRQKFFKFSPPHQRRGTPLFSHFPQNPYF